MVGKLRSMIKEKRPTVDNNLKRQPDYSRTALTRSGINGKDPAVIHYVINLITNSNPSVFQPKLHQT